MSRGPDRASRRQRTTGLLSAWAPADARITGSSRGLHTTQAVAPDEERERSFPRLWISVTLPRTRALVLAAEGDVVAALAAFDELDVDEAANLPFDHAWNRLVQGRLHRRVKQRRAAADTLGEALAIFERLGAPMWAEQA